MTIRIEIVNRDDSDKEYIVESKIFRNVNDIFDKEIQHWTYEKVIKYDDKYNFADWENYKEGFEFKYINEENNKIIKYASLLEDYMNL